MDSPKITHLSLCSGYGGIDLGLKGVFGKHVRTVAYAEIEAFAIECLLARMGGGQIDAAPIWPNLKSFPWGAFSDRVDILSGGYPCQPFSAAGKRLGTDDPRHLWPFIADGIRIMRPKLCFFENVEGHISLGLRAVIEELGSLGYKTTWGIFSAREVGAPHQRKRVFIMAHRDGKRGQLSDWWKLAAESLSFSNGETRRAWPTRPGEPQHEWEPPRVVANSASQRTNNGQQLCGKECRQGGALPCESDESGEGGGETNIEQTECREAEPSLGRDADGTAGGMDYAELCVAGDNRTDELRLLGNGVVPATATRAFLTLIK